MATPDAGTLAAVILLHPDRYAATSTTRKNGVVVHDSEGGEGTLPGGQAASAQLVGFLQRSGDRPSPSHPGGFYGAGYHAVACEDGSYLEVAGAFQGPYHAPPCNPTWWAICIPGRAAQTRDQWLGDISRNYVRAVARYIVDKHTADGSSWPLVFRTGAELRAGSAHLAGHPFGYTAHAEVSKAWGQTDHTDPGSSFPWDVLAADIAALITPSTTPEDIGMLVKPYDGADLDHIDPAQLDPCVLNLTGGIAAWVRDPAALAVQQRLGTGQRTEPRPVARADLKAYDLFGPLPTPGPAYTYHRPTVSGDFADE